MDEADGATHVEFEGLEMTKEKVPFGSSIGRRKAMFGSLFFAIVAIYELL